jgi:hypothetical protein
MPIRSILANTVELWLCAHFNLLRIIEPSEIGGYVAPLGGHGRGRNV